MSRTLAIASRELKSYFLSAGGYVILAMFLVLVGYFFAFRSFEFGKPSSMRAVFEIGTWLLLLICPAITMKAISEEYRLGTIECLLTGPVSELEVVLGKFLGAVGFLVVLFLPTLVHVVALELYGQPDYGELLCGYLGVLLAGAAYLASGILASTLTQSQVVAYLMTLFFWLIVNMGCVFATVYVSDFWASIIDVINPERRLNPFTIGLLDTSGIVYFLTLVGLFLIGATASMLWRRVP